MSTTRRFYLYLITLAALGVLAAGLGQLIALILDVMFKPQAQVGGSNFSQQQLSLGIAMTVIGGPLWYGFWRSIQRRVTGQAEEIGSALRKLYLNLVLTITSITAITGGSEYLRWLLSGAHRTDFNAGPLASFIVAGIIWFFHWWVSEHEGHPSPKARTLRRWYMYILSGFGLVWLATAVVQLVSAGVLALPMWTDTIVRADFWNFSTQFAVARIFFGGLAWYFHWFRMARSDADSVLRHVYIYLLAVTGGAVAALVAATITLQHILTFVFGGVTEAASTYFQFIGWAIPTMLIGAAIWGYHQRLAGEEDAPQAQRLSPAERIHLYLMSFIGLGTMSAGIILLFGLLLNLVIGISGRPVTPGTGWWQSMLGLCMALLIVGTPLWMYYWGRVLKRVEAGGIEEWRARARRIFLYGVVVISIGGLIATLVNIVYQLINGMLQGHANTILRESRWSIQVLLVAGPLLWYHLRIVRADQKRGAEAIATQKSVTLFTFDRTGTLASKIEAKLGYRIQVRHRAGDGADPPVTDDELVRIAAEVEAAAVPSVLLIAAGNTLTVVAYQEK